MSDKHNKGTPDYFEDLHIELQDLVAGYVDNEIDEKDVAIVEAHLAGCEACRLDVSRQQLVKNRLNEMPVRAMSAELHERLDSAINEAPGHEHPAKNIREFFRNLFPLSRLKKIVAPKFVMASGWGVALILLFMVLNPKFDVTTSNEIPMIQDVLTEYRYFHKTDLPVAEQEQTPSAPVSWENSRVLASWKTTVSGAPADAYAMRYGDSIVIQFRVDEAVFFRNPSVRNSVASIGNYQFEDNALRVMALPLKDSGLLMVGPSNKMPSLDKLTVKTI